MIGSGMRGGVGAVAIAAGFALLSLGGAAIPARSADRVGGEFALERIDLRFVGGEKVRVLAAGEATRAEADITFRGTGQLGGAWEIAEATTTAGAPQFRTLEQVSRLLGLGRRELLVSPPLPSAVTGAYLLRLRITVPNSESAAAPPTLRYFVGAALPAPAGGTGPAPELKANEPAAGAPGEGRTFSWQPVAGCIAYQVELYDKDPDASGAGAGGGDRQDTCLVHIPSALGRPPAAGVMVPGTRTEVLLGPLVAARLTAGKSYLWRVVALDRDGKVLCESPLKEMLW